MKSIISLLAIALTLVSCAKKNAEEQAAEDDAIIKQYIADNSLTALSTSSGLHYVIDVAGTGASCSSQSNVRVAYTGYFTDGEISDQSSSTGIEFGLQQVIQGWTEGIPYFKEGGSGKLLVPSALAYGKNGTSGIPPNSVLIFDIELHEVL